MYLAGVSTINYTGGEPFLREDFIDIIVLAAKKVVCGREVY